MIIAIFGLAISVPQCWAFGGSGSDSLDSEGGDSITMIGGGASLHTVAGQGATIPSQVPFNVLGGTGYSLNPDAGVPPTGGQTGGTNGGNGEIHNLSQQGGDSITM